MSKVILAAFGLALTLSISASVGVGAEELGYDSKLEPLKLSTTEQTLFRKEASQFGNDEEFKNRAEDYERLSQAALASAVGIVPKTVSLNPDALRSTARCFRVGITSQVMLECQRTEVVLMSKELALIDTSSNESYLRRKPLPRPGQLMDKYGTMGLSVLFATSPQDFREAVAKPHPISWLDQFVNDNCGISAKPTDAQLRCARTTVDQLKVRMYDAQELLRVAAGFDLRASAMRGLCVEKHTDKKQGVNTCSGPVSPSDQLVKAAALGLQSEYPALDQKSLLPSIGVNSKFELEAARCPVCGLTSLRQLIFSPYSKENRALLMSEASSKLSVALGERCVAYALNGDSTREFCTRGKVPSTPYVEVFAYCEVPRGFGKSGRGFNGMKRIACTYEKCLSGPQQCRDDSIDSKKHAAIKAARKAAKAGLADPASSENQSGDSSAGGAQQKSADHP